MGAIKKLLAAAAMAGLGPAAGEAEGGCRSEAEDRPDRGGAVGREASVRRPHAGTCQAARPVQGGGGDETDGAEEEGPGARVVRLGGLNDQPNVSPFHPHRAPSAPVNSIYMRLGSTPRREPSSRARRAERAAARAGENEPT